MRDEVAQERSKHYRVFEAQPYHAPFWLNHYHRVVREVLNKHLPSKDAEKRNKELCLRALVLLYRIRLGHSAEETSKKIAERGFSLTPNAVRQQAFRMNKRAEDICSKLGIEAPETPDALAHFDETQFEAAFRAEDVEQLVESSSFRVRIPAPKRSRGWNWFYDFDDKLNESLKFCQQFSRARFDERDVVLRFVYVPDTNTRELFACAPQHRESVPWNLVRRADEIFPAEFWSESPEPDKTRNA